MSGNYSLRVLLRPANDRQPEVASSELIFAELEKLGVAEDLADLGPEGTYVVWMSIRAASLEAAVGEALSHLEEAQERAFPGEVPDRVASIEILVDDESDTGNQPLRISG